MASYEVFSRPVLIRYKTNLCSKATFFHIITILIALIFPFLITFYVQGLWKKYDIYREQPDVSFKYQMLLLLETKDPREMIFWSTYEKLNEAIKTDFQQSTPSIENQEEDFDMNGKPDKLQMSIEIPLTTQKVVSVKMLLVFDYKLYLYSQFVMESIVYIENSSPLAGSCLTALGELALHQREPLMHTGTDWRYNIPVIDATHPPTTLETILSQYFKRNVTTYFRNQYILWGAGHVANEPFKINLQLIYPEETILYKVGFWQLWKWALVQYMAVFVIVWYCLQPIRSYFFRKQIIPTIVVHPEKEKMFYSETR